MVQRDQTIYERADIGKKAILKLREILKDHPVDVVGHMDLAGYCCGGGTVAIVKVDLEKVVQPR